ncbi:MAG: hypothetical protein MJ179_05655 [Treponema sp.]|nr:hypothetical protein [Treponema sp.]
MKKILFILSVLVLGLTFVSCGTTEEIPEDLSSAQLLQQGQNAYFAGTYEVAEKYYIETIKRFGDDTQTYIEARYELGHLYIKTKDYRKAYANFTEILKIYEATPAGYLPPAYKKLCELGLSKIPEKELEKIKAEN